MCSLDTDEFNLHLDTKLNNYVTEAKIMIPDHPVEVIRACLC